MEAGEKNDLHLKKDEEVIYGKKHKVDSVEVKLPKKVLIISAVAIVVLLLTLLLWQTGFYKKVYRTMMPASVDVTVTDKDSQKPIVGAVIEADGVIVKTGSDGKIQMTGLSAKKTLFVITATGYVNNNQTVKLNRRNNSLTISLILNIEKTDLTGKVTDFVSDAVLSGVAIKIGTFSATTDADGKFTVANLPTGEQTFDLSKEGYNAKSEKNTVKKDQPLLLTLAPAGKVYFISNRENGKRGIYVCNYDGSSVSRIVAAVGEQEDYNSMISPDRTKIAFLSTRERRKDSSGNYVADLFLINSDGSKLSKLDNTFGIYSATWSSDSKYLVWTSYQTEKDYAGIISIYSVKSGKTEKLVNNGSMINPRLSFDGTLIAWGQSTITGNPTSTVGIFYRKLSGGDIVKVADQISYDVNFSNDSKSIRYSYYDSTAQATKYFSYLISDSSTSTYTPEPNKNTGKVLSPDKKHFAYVSNRDGKSDVYVSDSDGKNEKKLTSLGTVQDLDWELNSQYIVLKSYKTGESADYIVSISGGDAKKVTDIYLEGNQMGN